MLRSSFQCSYAVSRQIVETVLCPKKICPCVSSDSLISYTLSLRVQDYIQYFIVTYHIYTSFIVQILAFIKILLLQRLWDPMRYNLISVSMKALVYDIRSAIHQLWLHQSCVKTWAIDPRCSCCQLLEASCCTKDNSNSEVHGISICSIFEEIFGL